jgi:hypothetical protein
MAQQAPQAMLPSPHWVRPAPPVHFTSQLLGDAQVTWQVPVHSTLQVVKLWQLIRLSLPATTPQRFMS